MKPFLTMIALLGTVLLAVSASHAITPIPIPKGVNPITDAKTLNSRQRSLPQLRNAVRTLSAQGQRGR